MKVKKNREGVLQTFWGTGSWTRPSRGCTPDWRSTAAAPPGPSASPAPPASGTPPPSADGGAHASSGCDGKVLVSCKRKKQKQEAQLSDGQRGVNPQSPDGLVDTRTEVEENHSITLSLRLTKLGLQLQIRPFEFPFIFDSNRVQQISVTYLSERQRAERAIPQMVGFV